MQYAIEYIHHFIKIIQSLETNLIHFQAYTFRTYNSFDPISISFVYKERELNNIITNENRIKYTFSIIYFKFYIYIFSII